MAATLLTPTTFANALKRYYSDDKVEDLTYSQSPILAAMPKFTEWTGDSFTEALIYENVVGGSAAFSNAQSNTYPIQTARFILTTVTDYQIAQITNETMLASKNDRG